tara:strand:+ start:477 stop:2861 length:2385 start_codon:yes stop_codon:yes gene_type:complete
VNANKSLISVFKGKKGTIAVGETSLEDLFSEVRDGAHRATIEALRAEEDEVRQSVLKGLLKAVSLSGKVTSGARAKAMEDGRFAHSGFLQIDLDADDLQGQSPADVRDVLADNPHIVTAFISPRGNGVKAVMLVPPAATKDEHTATFLSAERYMIDTYALKIDESTKDPVRICFVSFDPEARWNSQAVPLDTSAAPPAPKAAKPSTTPPSFKLGLNVGFPPPPHEGIHGWLMDAAWHCRRNGLDEQAATAKLQSFDGTLRRPFQQNEVRDAIRTVYDSTTSSAGTRPAPSDIPADVFPIPGTGVSYTEAAEIIFPAMGEARKLFIREREVHEIHSTIESDILAPVSPERFSSLVETTHRRVARREVKTKDGEDSVIWRTTTFPSSSAKILLQTDSARTALPTITQLANCPIITPEGNVLTRGYHQHAGGTFIGRGGKLQDVPFDTAVESLFRLLADFDFATPSDASRAFASLISPALKQGGWIDDDFPLDLAEADQSQSGKTFRQKIVCMIYNELQSSITSQKGGVGSLDEAVAAALIKGRPFITIDNFRGRMDSQIMESAIRGAGVVDCRTIKHRAEVNTRPFLWQLSTNGAELTRDLANRSIVTRIRKRPDGIVWHVHPEGSLEAHIRANQCFYLACVFAIIREWNRQGRPITGESRHDFRTWCRTLDGIVQLVGMSPLLDGHREQQLRTANPNLQWLREILLVMSEQDLGRELYASDLFRIAEDNDIAFPGNPHSKDDPAVRVGRILKTLFKDAVDEKIEVDGFEFSRTSAPDYSPAGGSRESKKYTVKKP